MYRHAAVSYEAAIAWNGAPEVTTEDEGLKRFVVIAERDRVCSG